MTTHHSLSSGFVRGGDHKAAHARPAGLARLREAISFWLEETSSRAALAACVAALLLIVAAVAVALVVSGHGMAAGQGTAAGAPPSDPAGTAGTSAAMPPAAPRPRATAVPSASPATPDPAAPARRRAPPRRRRIPPRLRPGPCHAAHPGTPSITAAEPETGVLRTHRAPATRPERRWAYRLPRMPDGIAGWPVASAPDPSRHDRGYRYAWLAAEHRHGGREHYRPGHCLVSD